jgi:membrane-associated phospholipid phosphatase
MIPLFYRLIETIKGCYRGRFGLRQLLMIPLTLLVVWSGFDWWYFVVTKNPVVMQALFPAVLIGAFVPMFGPAILLFVAIVQRNRRVVNTAWALAQAAMLGLGISSFYKVFTGRIPPRLDNLVTDVSHGFQLGILRGGAFWGWPSSHTTVAFAMAFALIQLYPDKKWIKPIALIYAFYIGLGISVSIHWFSEFIAGALLGSVIGTVVGRAFTMRFQEVMARLTKKSASSHNKS